MLKEFERQVALWTLIPSSGGIFKVRANGELVFSKKHLGCHAEMEEIRPARAAWPCPQPAGRRSARFLSSCHWYHRAAEIQLMGL
ncbi:MAG: Rdx family protein [Thermoflexus sp.]|nr:Rdx family protein [Thermoflexus sp.]